MTEQLTLRPYQVSCLKQIKEAHASGKNNVFVALATGAGKTAIAARWAGDDPVLYLCHTLSVIGQVPAEFEKWGVAPIVPAGSETTPIAEVIAGGARRIACHPASARNAAVDLSVFEKVICDEAHHAGDATNTHSQTIPSQIACAARQRGIPVLGISATPWRMSKKQGFLKTWDKLITGGNWHDLAADGYLADCVVERLDGEEDSRIIGAGAGVNSVDDYTANATFEANRENPVFIERAADHIKPEESVLVYCIGQAHGVAVALHLHEALSAPVGLLVSGKEFRADLPPGIETDPSVVRSALRRGDLRVVVNINMVTEGYDCPDVDKIIVLRPTKSLALWLQMCGRASRLADGKEYAHIVDLTDNTDRLGHPLNQWHWSLKPRGELFDGEAVMRNCQPRKTPGCGNQIYSASQECPHCGEAQGRVCSRCGKYRHWFRYGRNGTPYCSFCDLALGMNRRPRIADLPTFHQVESIYRGETKNGSLYYTVYTKGGRGNCFQWNRQAFVLIERYEDAPRKLFAEIVPSGKFFNVGRVRCV